MTAGPRPRLSRELVSARLPLLMLVTDERPLAPREWVRLVKAALAGGVNAVQLRRKSAGAGELYELTAALREVVGDSALLFVNDRLDVALAAGADGAQLPERALPLAAARRVAGDRFILGRSVHDPAGARCAEAEGADFVIAGHVFDTPSKQGQPPLGEARFQAIRDATRLPVLAIGGIGAATAALPMDRGADGVAVVSALLGAPDIEAAARDLRRIVNEHHRGLHL